MNKSEEWFDVVDDHDEVVDAKPRKEVHRLKLNHRAVHVLVFDQTGRLFLQKRSMLKDCDPGKWDSSASGHVDRGEDYDPCAIRELQEELGVAPIAPIVRILRVLACPETGNEFVWVYKTTHPGPFRLQPEEVDSGEWFKSEEIDSWLLERPQEFASSFILIWQKLRSDSSSILR